MKKSTAPPRLADLIFERYCRDAQVEDLRGDIQEIFSQNLQKMSVTRAKFLYWLQVLSLVFSYAVKRRKQDATFHTFSSGSFNISMLRNYFLIATRSLVRNRLFTVINIFGLAVGMSISVLVIAFLSFIWRYDLFHENKDQIYRIISTTVINSNEKNWASAPLALASHLSQKYSGISEIVKIKAGLNGEVSYQDRKVGLSGYYVDPAFLQVFTFPLVSGDLRSVLDKPHSMVVTKKGAQRLFGNEDPIGKTVTIDSQTYEITGVLENHPKHSHMQFEALVSYRSIEQSTMLQSDGGQDVMNFRNEYIYLLLANGTDVSQIELYLNEIATRLTTTDGKISFELQSLTDIAPGPSLSNSIGPDWDTASLSGFILVALLILLPASFNYANISVARSLRRMKEIGLRKVMGGMKSQIFAQFMAETVIIAFVALAIALYMFSLVRYEFLSMLVSADAISLELDGYQILYFILFALVVGLATGFVPAYYLSGIETVSAMKKNPVKTPTGFGFRKVLTVFQFALSLGFITSMVIVLNQYRQTINYDFGFQQSNILDVQLQGVDPQLVKSEFSKLSSVSDISFSSHLLGIQKSRPLHLKYNDQLDSIEVTHIFIDEQYIPNLGLTMQLGVNFPADQSGYNKILVNEVLAESLAPEDPSTILGRSFFVEGRAVEVIGVVKDFHFDELTTPIGNFIFLYDATQFSVANIKMTSEDVVNSIHEMQQIWEPLGGEKKFEAKFYETEMEEAYEYYFVFVKICGFLGFLAIVISCLGLLGMVVLTAEYRTKEVGIRKVMGASTLGLVAMLSKDFAKLIVVASCIALPLTYLFFDKIYLRAQHYKLPIGAAEMMTSVMIITILGLTTILSQTVKTARINPVDILRSE